MCVSVKKNNVQCRRWPIFLRLYPLLFSIRLYLRVPQRSLVPGAWCLVPPEVVIGLHQADFSNRCVRYT